MIQFQKICQLFGDTLIHHDSHIKRYEINHCSSKRP